MTVLTELKAGPRVVGAKQTRRAVNDGRALRVFLAKDADPNVTAPIEELCAQRQVSVEWADAMREVGDKMDVSLRETGLGGVAATPFGQAVSEKMNTLI